MCRESHPPPLIRRSRTSSASGMTVAQEPLDQVANILSTNSGKITSISVTPVSGEKDATKSATVTFEKEA